MMDWSTAETRLESTFRERPATLRTYRGGWGLFRRWLSGRAPTPELGADWLRGLSNKESTKASRRTALRWLFVEGLGISAAALPQFRPISPRPSVLTPAQIVVLNHALESPLERALVGVLYGGALRIAECLSLRVSDIDPEGFLLVQRKGGAHRGVPVPDDVMETLTGYLGGRTGGPVFPLGYHDVRRMLRTLARRIGLRDIRPHQLRHSAATALARDGVGLHALQEFLGHRSPTTTQIYIHLTPQELRGQLFGKKQKSEKQN